MKGDSLTRHLASRTGRVPSTTSENRPKGDAARDLLEPVGEFALVDGEEYYRISAYDQLPPFLMNLASDTDHWIFIASRGGLTAGRGNEDGSLFPYETVDRLYDGHHHTGPITLLKVGREGETDYLWAPFRERLRGRGPVERNLYKNRVGNRVIFEEIHQELGLTFCYRWSACEEFGLVRSAQILNHGAMAVTVSMLDGLRNILPFGVPLALMRQASCLVDAYKRVDCDPETLLGVFSLTSRIVDRPEAAEELRANVAWCHGLEHARVCLSIEAVASFRRGEAVQGERLLTGTRGNYLVHTSFEMEPQSRVKWHIVADVGRDHRQIAALRVRCRDDADLDRAIEESLDASRDNLLRNVGSADGLQLTGHREASVHHMANVLFNNMRGGVFAENYSIPTVDLADFLATRNREVARRHANLVKSLPAVISVTDLIGVAEGTADGDFLRLSHEYLPIHFSRRHGDPSRPWNRFDIRLRNPDGTRALRYEGNWRDIFQNWEALALSFPGFLQNMIVKFVNASTVDGFNPYRITRDGFEWEVADPDDPWSYIGYWGDHQIVYLLRLLEAMGRFYPGTIERLLTQEIFCYAEVPYRIRAYREILKNPHETIDYDLDLASRIEGRVHEIGTDGQLVRDAAGSVYNVNLVEKLLVPALSKISNLVLDGGIWMNTQRPEWNDANNALVGNGVSVVTLCYLRRYLCFLEQILSGRRDSTAVISAEVVQWFREIHGILGGRESLLESKTPDARGRKELLDALGEAFSRYRVQVYAQGFAGKDQLAIEDVTAFCRMAVKFLDHSIRGNRRADGLYYSYNILDASRDGQVLAITPLYEMLEGQVAALSSGVVEPAEALRLVSSLFDSCLYREDQKSFLLYPERELPSFLDKNVIPERRVRSVELLRELLEAGESTIIVRDALGACRFHPDFANAHDLEGALDRLAADFDMRDRVARDRQRVLEVYEEVFNHRSFTGRSGAMYGYEGLGCIYWHMVSKLLLAVQEIILGLSREEDPAPILAELAHAYYRIRAGLGFEKTVVEYGAFPTDPYSHTPRHAGAQQPGMTGQVKEEILTRFGELGVHLEDGTVRFRPVLLRRSEFLAEPGTFHLCDLLGTVRSIEVPAGSLAFSFCQVPIIYELIQGNGDAWIRVTSGDGPAVVQRGNRLGARDSAALFGRTGGILRIDVGVPERFLCDI